ncbi:trypsin-like serine protease [uncultured Sneathiella sp.]|uniref:trypsin-like serine peptidase n=1 Tax=uncultured Sneathiella sp. TaxID=879315 RepID=UPI0030EE93D9|tara:strand:+ start:25941 stop:26801 length:861 start_codon:yes stop_codon:yes gene_type:complete
MKLFSRRIFRFRNNVALTLAILFGTLFFLPVDLQADEGDMNASGLGKPLEALKILGIKGDDNRVRVNVTSQPWQMVGRLNHSGNHCTAVLVGPETILTAAHCFWDRRRNKWSVASAYHFVLGYDKGEIAAHSKVKSFVVAGDNASVKKQSRPVLVNDWAIARLEKPLGKSFGFAELAKVSPRDLDKFIAAGATVMQGGYSRDVAHVLTADMSCQINNVQSSKSGSILVHSCDATKGDSGSPIFLQTGKGFTLLGIHVATLPRSDGKTDGVALSVDMFQDDVTAAQK